MKALASTTFGRVLALRLTGLAACLQFALEVSVVWQLCGLSVNQLVVTIVFEAFPVPSLPGVS